MISLSDELQQTLYDICTILLSSVALLAYNLSRYKEKKLLLSKFSYSIIGRYQEKHPQSADRRICLLTVAEIVLISLFQHGLVAVLNTLLGKILQTGTNYFGMIYFMPILLFLYCWLFGIDPFKQIDLITPAYPLALVFMKLGCFFAGCCGGTFCEIGSAGFTFPIQLLEVAVALGLFLFLHFYREKAKEGTLLPFYVVAYSAIRFSTEFLSNDPDVLGPLKTYHFLCVLGVIYGLVLFVVLNKHRDKIKTLCLRNAPQCAAKEEVTE